jgi:hypothetical protein
MGIMHFQLNFTYIQVLIKLEKYFFNLYVYSNLEVFVFKQKIKATQAKLIREKIENACKMTVIENRRELVDRIKRKEIDDSEDRQNVTKYVAVEAVDKCMRQYQQRTSHFLDELYKKRAHVTQLLAAE